jgi:S1-C subfamily serine protease
MRSAVVLALAFLVGTCAACGTVPPPAPAESPAAKVAQLERRTVALVQPSAGGFHTYCTGVWVDGNTILTANHCVRDLDVKATVAYATRADVLGDEVVGVHGGVLVARDEEHDLALVYDFVPPRHDTAKVSDPSVGQNVQTMGHPLGLFWSYSRGQVAAIRFRAFGEETEMWWVQATAPVSPGNSGGGLFDDDGNLVGICHGVLTRGQALNFWVHPKYIRELLAAAPAKEPATVTVTVTVTVPAAAVGGGKR